MNILKVLQIGGREGKPVKNQYIIQAQEGQYLQSYDKIIVFRSSTGSVELDPEYYNYSTTTSKYRNLFLGADSEQVQKRIASGEYILKSLN